MDLRLNKVAFFYLYLFFCSVEGLVVLPSSPPALAPTLSRACSEIGVAVVLLLL